ncbi:hypothetical protein F5B22DRAFT_658387 [Xylaria bambusicola]|uniref:uncharacterized protein n=1 Tax=Xylaria bambusicola TaxID=326684 RepID=UPI002008A0E1|nr:uncharacterized protein F5B22DRAFT_658387 [Xylaria bambusicola]KAI0525560.1 hypothetical protein F5B22DRAFT_658387 [Xylaria bambusicola]
MSSELHLLKSNGRVSKSRDGKPYHTVVMTNPDTDCQLFIAATRPLPDPIYVHLRTAEWKQALPLHYVWFRHDKEYCPCASFSKTHDSLFETWQHLHTTLRYQSSDNASYAFYPDYEYEEGEALAHASLVASLALGMPIPKCYEHLIRDYGARNLQKMPDEVESSDEE